jgi:hypothetical protein
LLFHSPFGLLQPPLIIADLSTLGTLQHFTPSLFLLDVFSLLFWKLRQLALLSMQMSQCLGWIGNGLQLGVGFGVG